jgi:hypothetical protein
MNFETGTLTQRETPESIKAAAVRIEGKIYTGMIHPDIIVQIAKDFPDWENMKYEEGFLTTTDRFIDRREAAAIARENDLFRERFAHEEELHTEHLKPEVLPYKEE